ncbi:MAG: OsmC family protein [Elusimicrobia bacterium]|nr:OsmC family protein [Elusimicrobiota bacterium]
MTKLINTYLGDGQVRIVHTPTDTVIMTDLPPDNGGKGRAFSATDLLAAALSACILSIMGKMADARGDDLAGLKLETEKVMAQNPRRVGKFILNFKFPPSIDKKKRDLYLSAVKACPVHNSISKEIEIVINVE